MSRQPESSAEVCIIGTGPAGALVGDQLVRAGYSVVFLEAGPRFDTEDRVEQMESALQAGDSKTIWEMGGPRDAYESVGSQYYPLNSARVKGVGGSSLHWQGMVMRLHEQDFRLQSSVGMGRDWPLSYTDLQPYYAAAERELGVAGADDNPFAPPRSEPFPMTAFPPSQSDSIFAPACAEVGITTHSVPNARNSESTDEAGACVGYGTCAPVCPSGAKYDSTRQLAHAESQGARIIDRAPVKRLIHDDSGSNITAAEYSTPEGKRYHQEAKEFVVAAGGIETPRLLLASATETHPDGLANESGAVGRFFSEHLFAGMGGTINKQTRQKHIGFHTTESHQFYDRPDDSRTAIKLEFLNNAGPSPAAMAIEATEFGDELLNSIQQAYGSHIAMGALVEQLPDRENRITLSAETTDPGGMPIPVIDWDIDTRTKKTVQRANEIQRTVLETLDVDIEWTVGPDSTGPAYHHMCTTRMGTDPTESVVNPQLRCHELSNLSLVGSSVFVTGGAMNPTLTIAALALWASEHIAARLGEEDIEIDIF